MPTDRKNIPVSGKLRESELESAHDDIEDGVDITLIRWMLTLTPLERLRTAQNHAHSVMRVRNAIKRV